MWVAAAVGALACVVDPGPEGDDALVEHFTKLHSAVYDAYQIGPSRDRLWTHLARSFAADALTREYVEHYSTAVQMKAESIEIDILNVDYDDVSVVRPQRLGDPIRVQASWSVGGIVHHRDHRHPRINSYRANYTLAPSNREGELRIVETRLLAMKRIRGAADVLEGGQPASSSGFFSVTDLVRAGVVEEDVVERDGVVESQEDALSSRTEDEASTPDH